MDIIKAEKSDTRDSATIGILVAISLVIFFVIDGAARMTLIGTVANIPITVFFTSIAYMLPASKARKRGTSLTVGTVSALLGLTAANVIGVIVSVVGWLIAEIIVSTNHYKDKKVSIFAYVLGCTLHSAGYMFPMYLSDAQHLTDR